MATTLQRVSLKAEVSGQYASAIGAQRLLYDLLVSRRLDADAKKAERNGWGSQQQHQALSSGEEQEARVPVPLRSHWPVESQDCWTRLGRDDACLVASHSRLSRWDPRPRGVRVSPDQLDCPASLSLRPLRSTVSHEF